MHSNSLGRKLWANLGSSILNGLAAHCDSLIMHTPPPGTASIFPPLLGIQELADGFHSLTCSLRWDMGPL